MSKKNGSWSLEILAVDDLIPLVPVGAFSAVLDSCKGRDTLVGVISGWKKKQSLNGCRQQWGSWITQWGPHWFASRSIQHGLFPGNTDFDVNVSHRASIQLRGQKTE